MKAWEIYTLGGGDFLYNVFNGVAALTAHETFLGIITMVIFMGGVWVLFESALNNKFLPNVRWFLQIVFIVTLFLMPKADILIKDDLNPNRQYQHVSNVPFTLAMFASLTSTAGHEITKLFEVAFLNKNNLSYHETGMLFGAKLVEHASNLKITNSEFSSNINSYMKQCVFYDIMLGRYSIDELKESTDIWETITKNPAKSRSFMLRAQNKTEIKTCAEGAPILTAGWKKEIDSAAGIFGNQMFPGSKVHAAPVGSKSKIGNTNPQQKALLLSRLPMAYQDVMNISKSADALIQQNMLINSVKSASNEFSGNYLRVRSDIQTRTAYQATKAQGAQWVPILRAMLEVLFYGAFPLVVMLAMLPIGGRVITSYLGLFLWLQSWGPLYAILNMIMNLDLYSKVVAASSLSSGGHGLALVTKAGIAAINQDISIAAGSWSMMIPFIPLILVYGAKSVTSLATATLAIPQAAANSAANEISTGNISLGNSSVGNHSFNNVSGNKWNDSGFHDSGRMQMINSMGGMSSVSSGGQEVHDMTGAFSKIAGVGISRNNSESIELTKTAAQHAQMSESFGALADQSRASAYRKAGEYLDTQNLGKTSHISYGRDVGVDERKSIEESLGALREHAKGKGKDLQTQMNMAATASGEVMTQGGGAGGKGLGGKLSLGGNVELRANSIATDNYNRSEQVSEGKNYQQHLNTVMSAIQSNKLELTDSQGNSLNESITKDLTTADRFEEQERLNYETSKMYSTQAQYSNSRSLSVNNDLSEDTIERLANVRDQYGRPMGKLEATKRLSSSDPDEREYYLRMGQGGSGVNKYLNSFNEHANGNTQEDLKGSYAAKSKELDAKTVTEYNDKDIKEKFEDHRNNKAIDNSFITYEVDRDKSEAFNKIEHEKNNMDAAKIKREVDKKVEEGAFVSRAKSLVQKQSKSSNFDNKDNKEE